MNFFSFSDELLKIAGKSSKIPISKADAAIYKTIAKKCPVKIKVDPKAQGYGGGYFDLSNKEIGLSDKNFAVLAHEIGHAKVDQHFLGRLLENKATRLAHMLSPLSGLGVGMLLPKNKSWGLLVPAALATPTLVSEGLATHVGGKLLRDSGATDKQLAAYKKITGRGWLSYLGLPLLGTVLASNLPLK